jgi:hypothetical protein
MIEDAHLAQRMERRAYIVDEPKHQVNAMPKVYVGEDRTKNTSVK